YGKPCFPGSFWLFRLVAHNLSPEHMITLSDSLYNVTSLKYLHKFVYSRQRISFNAKRSRSYLIELLDFSPNCSDCSDSDSEFQSNALKSIFFCSEHTGAFSSIPELSILCDCRVFL